ncbi:MAG: diguanylate cyclase, partial [Cyanobacteria bacterium J06648_11]
QAVDLAEMRGTIETLKQVVSDRTRELQSSNRQLRSEVSRRQAIERQLLETNEALTQEIEDRRWIERELFREKELAQVTLQSIADAVITTDARGRVSSMNPQAEEYTGWKMPEASGRSMAQIFVTFDEITQLPCECATQHVLQEGTIVNSQGVAAMQTRSGRVLSVESTTAPIRNRAGEMMGTVTVFRDVSAARQLSRQLDHQARHDTLTGLLNRGEFERRLEAAIASTRHGDLQHVLCYMDLDRFKIVNDTCGHEAGDELLRQLTQLLREEVRASDVLARLGGDEFGLLLFQCPLARAEGIANQFRERIATYRFGWETKVFTVGLSIGLVAIDEHTRELAQVLGAADAACFAAKERGRNRIQIYQTEDAELSRQRRERLWVTRLERALEEDRFVLFGQDIVPIQTDDDSVTRHHHCEILIRLKDEDGALVPPMAFIPAAERYGLMPQIDRWVVNAFFRQYRESCSLDEMHSCDRVFTINLSGKSLSDESFLQFLDRELTDPPLNPKHLCFEITETAAIANLSLVTGFIHKLKQRGCRFALDDFGSGMSS